MSKKEVIKKQIKAIQRTGKVNMCDSVGVALIAKKLGFDELLAFVQTDNYVTFVFTGDESILPE
jgi:hypothetical protein